MACTACGDRPKSAAEGFTKAVIEIKNQDQLVLFRKVVLPASLGDETMVPPVIGKYRNVLLEYEVNGNLYLYSSDGIPTKLSANTDELERQIEEIWEVLPDQFTIQEWNSLWA